MKAVLVFEDLFFSFMPYGPDLAQVLGLVQQHNCHVMNVDFTLCAIDPWKDSKFMKEDGELGVSDF